MSGFSTASPSIIRLGGAVCILGLIDQPRGQFLRLELNKSCGLPSKNTGVRNAAVPSMNERVELAIKIMRYRELSRRTADEEFLRPIKAKIAELEQKLRGIDE